MFSMPFGAFELAIIGNGYDFMQHRLCSHYKNVNLKLWTELKKSVF